jgi:hypothetical protein
MMIASSPCSLLVKKHLLFSPIHTVLRLHRTVFLMSGYIVVYASAFSL